MKAGGPAPVFGTLRERKVGQMKYRWLARIAAVVCAACLAVGVMSQTVFAGDDSQADAGYTAELPQATFVVLGAADEATPSPEVTDNRMSLPLYIGQDYAGECTLIGAQPYVSVAGFLKALGVAGDVNDQGSALSLAAGGVVLTARVGQAWFECNGRYLYLENGAQELNGSLALPLEQLVKCFGVAAAWDRVQWRVTVENSGIVPLQSGDEFYDEADVYWLSRMICAMAAEEPFETKVAVGSVCVNRMKDADFGQPANIYQVIFARNQFDIVTNGMIYSDPDEEATLAAKLALDGWDPTGGATYVSEGDMGTGYQCLALLGGLGFYTAA